MLDDSETKKRQAGVRVCTLRVERSIRLSLTDDCGGACAFLPAGVHLAASSSSSSGGDRSVGVGDGEPRVNAVGDDGRGAVTLRALWTASAVRLSPSAEERNLDRVWFATHLRSYSVFLVACSHKET